MTASIAVALLALAFTIGSFWWLQARRGHLVAYEPQTYSGYIRQDGFRLRLPLTIYNTGARAVVVTDLRAVFVDTEVTVPVITFRHSVKPRTDDVADFAHPFPVPGRQAVSRFVEFGRRDGAPQPATRHRVRVDVRTGDDGQWSELVGPFDLTAPDPHIAGSYIAHRRDPSDDAPPLPATWDGAESP